MFVSVMSLNFPYWLVDVVGDDGWSHETFHHNIAPSPTILDHQFELMESDGSHIREYSKAYQKLF